MMATLYSRALLEHGFDRGGRHDLPEAHSCVFERWPL